LFTGNRLISGWLTVNPIIFQFEIQASQGNFRIAEFRCYGPNHLSMLAHPAHQNSRGLTILLLLTADFKRLKFPPAIGGNGPIGSSTVDRLRVKLEQKPLKCCDENVIVLCSERVNFDQNRAS
jgi:hypothetical protein